MDAIYLLENKQLFNTKSGKIYGLIKLSDDTGKIDAKLWEQAEKILTPLKKGQLVQINGRVQHYNGIPQIILSSLYPIYNLNPINFLPKSPFSKNYLWRKLINIKNIIKNKNLQDLLNVLLNNKKILQAFEEAPGAKNAHHAYVHGLLEHTVSVADIACLLIKHYSKHKLNQDLLLTGIIFHDIGKINELTLGPPLDYTDIGRLEGHIILGVRILDTCLIELKKFPINLAIHLRHMIISHHGSELLGSPTKPKTLEALLLHSIDDLDAKIAMMSEFIKNEKKNENNWSSYHRLLERHIYTGPEPIQFNNNECNS